MELINDYSETLEINNFIDKNLCDCDNDLLAIKELKKIDYYLNENFSFLSSEVLINLLHNDKINKYFTLLLKKDITRTTIKCITSNEIITSMMELYCKENNIVIINEKKKKYIIEYTDDTLAMYIAEARNKRCELSTKDEIYLAIRIEENDKEALNFMVECNLLLVPLKLHCYRNQGVDDLDLIQEGNKYLIKATKLFNYRKGWRFSTYACWAINRGMRRAVQEQGTNIRIAFNTQDVLYRINKAAFHLEQMFERKPTYNELAIHTGIPYKEVRRVLSLVPETISYNQRVKNDEDGDELLDFLSISNDPVAEEVTCNIDYEVMIESLDPKEREILVLHYGLEDDKKRTLKQIGETLDCSKQAVYQREQIAIKKLKRKYKEIYSIR